MFYFDSFVLLDLNIFLIILMCCFILFFQDGVILGADTRATSGSIVADKNCSKIHYIAPNM